MGANARLTSLHTVRLNHVGEVTKILVELISSNVDAIRFNLAKLETEMLECAISINDSTSTLFVRESNVGNCSLLEGDMSVTDCSELKVLTLGKSNLQ